MENAPTQTQILTRLIHWLKSNSDVVKAGGLAHRAELDDAAMSLILAGKRKPRAATLARLTEAAKALGFDQEKATSL